MPNDKRLEKAAILLLGLGEDNAAKILQHMEASEVQKLGLIMSNMQTIKRGQIQNAIEDFASDVAQQTSFGVGADNFVKNMLENALGKDKAAGLFNRIQLGIDTDGLEAMGQLPALKIAELISNEHAQIQALLISYLDEEKAADVLTAFPEEQTLDLLIRTATLDEVQPEMISELNTMMEEKLSLQKNQTNNARLGGSKNVANILNYMRKDKEAQMLSGIDDFDNKLASEIKDLMFVFSHFIDADDKSMQTLLRNVDSQTLLLALKGTDDKVREKFFANMSKRAASLLQDDIESMSPQPLSDVEAAQKQIISVAERLREQGEFRLLRGGEEML